MLRNMLENKYIRLYNIAFLILLLYFTIKRIYLIFNSPIIKADHIIYYSPRSAILGFALFILVFVISNILFYFIDRKIKQGK